MSGTIQVGGPGKAHCVVIRADGTRDVVDWQLGEIHVPAVHRVRATLVRFPVMYYVHAAYGPEVMASRSEDAARLGWDSRSFNLPLPPEVVGHFNLLSQAVATAYKELKGVPTRAYLQYPTTIRLREFDDGHDEFLIYLNHSAAEFYHLLFAVGEAAGHHDSHLTCESADLSTVPKLQAWLRPFETAKKKLYRDNGFDWNPRRGPIELGPTRGDL